MGDPPGVDVILDLVRSFVFVACELFVLLLVFSPFLFVPVERGVKIKPFGPAWVVFGAACCAFIGAALFAPT